MLGTSVTGSAQPEQNVKAAFVFNFIRFTEWPASRLATRDAPLWLCIWSGDFGLSEAMKALAGRSIDERTLQVTTVERPDELGKCHALFVADPGRPTTAAWLRRAEALDVLTVGDGEGFARAGGMLGLVPDGARLRFEINDRAIKRSGLKLGAQLYQLGRATVEGTSR